MRPNLVLIATNLLRAANKARKDIQRTIAGKIPSAEDVLDGTLAVNQRAEHATAQFLKSVANLTGKILSFGRFSTDDYHPENFPFNSVINTEIQDSKEVTKKINPLLKYYQFDNYSDQNVVRFFNENTVYPSITDSGEKLESLKDFGISHERTGIRATLLALTTKHLVRKNVSFILKNGIPQNLDEANKAISFLVFAFANHKVLLGDINEGANHASRYRAYVKSAVEKDNILPIALIREFTGFSLSKDIFKERPKELTGVISSAKRSKDPDGQKIATYIKNRSLEKTFPEIFDNK